MSEYFVQAVSREEMRQLAFLIRKEFGYEDVWWIPVDKLLDQMCEAFDEFSYEIIPDEDWEDPLSHAYTDISSAAIKIRESVYEAACNGHGRDRMTIVHEIAHYILICDIGLKLYRRNNQSIKCFNDPEWQAKCLAGEILIPFYKLKKCKRIPAANRVQMLCGVSEDAAEYQLKYLVEVM